MAISVTSMLAVAFMDHALPRSCDLATSVQEGDLLTSSALVQENAARLKAYKAKLVIFPKRSNKPKSGDSSAEELKTVPQFKGPILPLVHEKVQLETVKLTDELKVSIQCSIVSPTFGAVLRVDSRDHHKCL